MADRESIVDDVAGAILDGTPVDWRAAETASGDLGRGLIDELRLLAAVADLHRLHHDGRPPDGAPAGVWGHLRLLERIGGGSFGEVYRAFDTRLEREVAVKLMPAGEADAAGVAAIVREARLLARVRHPGVVTVYDAQQIGDRVGLWMEFVRGRTLEERLDEHGVSTPAEAIEVGIELCRAVSAVHDAGLLHRDIKTQNVMRAGDGRLVLMDFGVGRELTDGSVTDLAGTPLYLAPEIFRGQPATARTDLYGIGVLLFHILTGSFPVRATLVSELRLAHERGEVQPIVAARPDLPANLAAVIARAIHADPERRHPTAAALAADLEAVRPRVRSWRAILGAAAAALVVVGASLAIARGWVTMGAGGGRAMDPQGWVLVGALDGTTGDAGLDAALQQAVVGELEASPYVNVFPTAWVREILVDTSRSASTPIDETLGLEISRREGLAALVTGSLGARDGLYRLALRVVHVPTGRVLATPAEEHPSREAALRAALGLGRHLRELLGESGASIQATSPPLGPVTSQSFEATRHFALGRALYEEERAREALPHFLEAITHDPAFAMAHSYLSLTYGYLGEHGLRQAAMEQAAALARRPGARLGPIEREKILADYSSLMERFHEAAAHLRAVLDLRPGDGRTLANLGLVLGSLREYQPAIEAFEAAWQSYPHPRVRWMLADMYSASGRPESATALVAQHLDRPTDWIAYAKHLVIAGKRQEAGGALAEAERRAHTSDQSWADLSLAKADFLRSEGRYDAAAAALQQGLDRSGPAGLERLDLAMASLFVDAGRRAEAIAHVRRIDAGLARNRIVHGVLSARAGDLETADAVLARLEVDARERQAPRPQARVHQLRAEVALSRGEARAAHEHAVQAVRAFTTTWTLTTLARAQQAVGLVDEAITTWTSILERPGERATDWDAPAYSQVVLARYELARLLDEAGRLEDAQVAYDEFLRLWERADPDLDPLEDARRRRARLAPGQGAQSTPAGRVPKPAA